MKRCLHLLLCLLAGPGTAAEIGLTGGTITAQDESPSDSVRLPREAWRETASPSQVEGAIRRTAYSGDANLTTLQLLEPSRTALEAEGYEVMFTCADAACGGFDFRFQLDLLPAPEMHVDLGNYRYLLMEKPGAEPHTVSFVASSSTTAGFLHVTEVFTSRNEATDPAEPIETPVSQTPTNTDLIDTLLTDGHAILADLEFATGSSELGPGPYPSLVALADWLEKTPTARVVLVGHTDAVGSLEANAALSNRRAASVLARLTSLGVRAGQLQSAGAGALSPVTNNLTDTGRAENRRVEVVLLSLQQ